jgi:GT2 family glycosyltransferase
MNKLLNSIIKEKSSLLGSIDGLYGREIHGWFFHNIYRDKKLYIRVLKNNEPLAEGGCIFEREDVLKIHGVLMCGFKINIGENAKLSELTIIVTDKLGLEENVGHFFKNTLFKLSEIENMSPEDKEFVLIKEVIKLKEKYEELRDTFNGLHGDTQGSKASNIDTVVNLKNKLFIADLVELIGESEFRNFLKNNNKLIINYGIIPWNFRIQRPQHIAENLSRLNGCGIIYFNPSFHRKGSPSIIFEKINAKIIQVNINISVLDYEFYSQSGSDAAAVALIIKKYLLNTISPENIYFVKVDHPSWWRILDISDFEFIVYDKMDEYIEFSNSTALVGEADRLIQEKCDLSIFSTESLEKEKRKKNLVLKNGCQIEHFVTAFETKKINQKDRKVVIGYVGAVSEWFDFDLINELSLSQPNAEFKIIGNVDTEIPEIIANNQKIKFYGEVPYSEIPFKLRDFDVGLIPFKITELIKHVDPVKMYEYAACGIATVSTNMPAIKEIDGVVYKSKNNKEFLDNVNQVINSADNEDLVYRRIDYAKSNTWEDRSASLLKAIESRMHKFSISIIMLHYGRLVLTEAAVYSIIKNSTRNNQLIVVDNTVGELNKSSYLTDLHNKSVIKIVTPEKNLGFAGGMNFGSTFATGNMIVLSNNDIYVSKHWDSLMLRHFSSNEKLGLLATVTNMTGNEQKMNLQYTDMKQMERISSVLAKVKPRKTYYVNNVAFLLVMIPTEIYKSLGGLDEIYEYGYFEDDDFCKKLLAIGKKIGIADDVFIHHEHGASFNLLGDDIKSEIFKKNKSIFEKKWGKWIPHKYRNSINFG